MNIRSIFFLLVIALVALSLLSTAAFAAEALYICRPCSRSFIPEAKSVLEELDLEDKVRIKTTSCLGDCDKPVVLKFQNKIYTSMDREKLKMLLMEVFDLS